MARKYANYDGTLPTYDKNKLGDMIVSIKAALITGYKDIKPAGWEMLYESQVNTDDTSKRIVVRSKAVDSEQKVFEIEDISDVEGSIKCWDGWTNGVGVNLLMQAKINKNQSWGSNLEIIANDKFVHLVVNTIYHAFGDIDDISDAAISKTIITDMLVGNAAAIGIASTLSQSKIKFKSISNIYVCRSLSQSNVDFGYSAFVNWNPNEGDIYIGGDKSLLPNVKLKANLYQTELLALAGGIYTTYGILPMLFYSDNPLSINETKVLIAGKQKIIKSVFIKGAAMMPFVVDE